jgi:hypothetical protein
VHCVSSIVSNSVWMLFIDSSSSSIK